MTNCLLSVALPVYNGADFLREALDSILAQSFADFELVVSDNSSTDATPQILAEYAARDARLRVSRSETFLPQADNVNRAVDLCEGEWIKLFCHDDLMKPDCLQTIHRAIVQVQGSRVGLIGNGEEWLFANGYRHAPPEENGSDSFVLWKGSDLVGRTLEGRAASPLPSLTTATVRREGWRNSSRFDNRFAHFDIFFWSEFLLRWDYLFIPQVLTTNRIHGAQVAVSARKTMKTVQDHRAFWTHFLKAHRDELQPSLRARTRVFLKPLRAAGSVLAIALLKGSFANAREVLLQLPRPWLPMLVPLTVYSLVYETRRLAPFRGKVPLNLLHPG